MQQKADGGERSCTPESMSSLVPQVATPTSQLSVADGFVEAAAAPAEHVTSPPSPPAPVGQVGDRVAIDYMVIQNAYTGSGPMYSEVIEILEEYQCDKEF